MKKINIVNIFLSIVSLLSFFKMVAIENTSRLAQYINTDYYMKSLPFVYICLISLNLILILNIMDLIFNRKK